MSEQTPLQLAGESLMHLFNFPNEVRENARCFSRNFPSLLLGKEKMYELYVGWKFNQFQLFFVLGAQFDLPPLQQGGTIRRTLEKSAEPFLEDHYNGLGSLNFLAGPDGGCVPSYRAMIKYETLEDEEVESEFRASLLRGFYMLELLAPVFSKMELGWFPNASERMAAMTTVYGHWELNIATDPSDPYVRLPPRLFGGINTCFRN